MNDPIVAARALIESGDVAGAERVLATALQQGKDVLRVMHALVAICIRSGEIGFRAQQAFDSFCARASDSTNDRQALLMLARLYKELDVRDAALETYDLLIARGAGADVKAERAELASSMELPQIGDLPPLEGFDLRGSTPGSSAPSASALDLPRPVTPPAQGATKQAVVPASDKAEVPHDIRSMFRPGVVISGRYQVEQRIGRGGYATVLRVRDKVLDEVCALKIFHHSGDADEVARFKREVSLSRRVVHENVVKLYDIGQVEGFWFLTMELLEGADLAKVMREGGYTLVQGLRWMIGACRGLHAAHMQGIVHRDVKPANMFIHRGDQLKLMDFGIAKPIDAATLTSKGMFVGTPQFVPPEQVKGEEVTPRSDIYSLGVVLYVVATGTLPFKGKEIAALLMQHVANRPEPPSARNPDVPAMLDALILSCMEKKPGDRPEDCNEVAETLETILKRL